MPKLLHKTIGIILFLGTQPCVSIAQAPTRQWDKAFGGAAQDELHVIQQTSDGGYILGGESDSGISGNKTAAGKGRHDYWVIKVDAGGNKQWEQSFGGPGEDYLRALQQTADGGYLLGGYSESAAGNDKTQPVQGQADYWVIKLNAAGVKQWDKTLGGSGRDYLQALQQTSDGGYILGGESYSDVSGDKTQPSRGNPGFFSDYWIVKLDPSGNKQWDRSFGGSDADTFTCLEQTRDGGYVLGGYSMSSLNGDKTQDRQAATDYWVVKVDANGTKQWDKTFGSYGWDFLLTLRQTTDGGYILGGLSTEGLSGDKTQYGQGAADFWLVKTDANGTKQWDRNIGGAADDYLHTLQQTADGGYILGGVSYSGATGDKTQPSQGKEDYWLVKTDATGITQWDRSFGGSNSDYLFSLQKTQDGGYLLGGRSDSGVSGDKTSASQGGFDYWIIKLGSTALASQAGVAATTLTAYPNPATTHLNLPGTIGTPYRLLNYLGQVVFAGRIAAQPLNIDSLPAGVYLAQYPATGRTIRFVKK